LQGFHTCSGGAGFLPSTVDLENGWLEDEHVLLGWLVLKGRVREGQTMWATTL